MKTIGLALGSGGVRGLAHVGVIKSLRRHHIPIDYIAGSSIGAWVGAHYALFEDPPSLETLTVGKKKEKLLSFFEPSLTSGLIKGKKIDRLLSTWLDDSTFADTSIPLRLVATDLISGQPVILDRGPLAAAARASMAIPGLFTPVKCGEQLLVDGGICHPIPDDVVRQMGADIVIAVNLDNFQEQSRFVKPQMGLTQVTVRATELFRHYLAQYCLNTADIIIQPPLSKYSSWQDYFRGRTGAAIVRAGELATDQMIPAIKAQLRRR